MADTKNSKTKESKAELTPFQQENIEVIKAVLEYKTNCEANVVAVLWKHPDLLPQTNLTLEDFSNNIWKVYFTILDDIIINEKKNVIDETIVGMYLQKHSKLRKIFEEYGGYSTVADTGEYIKEEAFDGYLRELRKWNAVIKLAKYGWIDKARMSEYVDMSAEDIYDELQIRINDIFVNIDNDIQTYDISEGLDELIDKLDDGMAIGLPYEGLPILTEETGGQYLGSITLLGGLSNSGKSTLARSACIPSVVANNEKLVIILNEEGIDKTQRELLVMVVNNILKKDLQKHILRDGDFTDETKEILREAAEWIREHIANHTITVIPLQEYKTKTVIKLIKKYTGLGVRYFLLDTFKMDAGKVTDHSWLELQQNMVAINDAIKPEANNVHIMITFQLAKGSSKQRYYTQDNIGVSKNIIDPVSTCLMIRDLFEDEKDGEKNALKVYKMGGQSGKSKIPVKLDGEKFYQIIFIIKNREGAHNYQLVVEHDLSRNIIKEVGFCTIAPDLW